MSALKPRLLMAALALTVGVGASLLGAPARADDPTIYDSDEMLFRLVSLVCGCKVSEAAKAPLLQLRTFSLAKHAAVECRDFGYDLVSEGAFLSAVEPLMAAAEVAGINRLGASYVGMKVHGPSLIPPVNPDRQLTLAAVKDLVRGLHANCAAAAVTPFGRQIIVRPSPQVEAAALVQRLAEMDVDGPIVRRELAVPPAPPVN